MDNSPTVLVADDEPDICEVIRRILTRAGAGVLVATGVREAARLAVEHPGGIHLLLVDLKMPGGSGAELAALVTAARPGIPVLYMSGLVAWHPTVLELGPDAAVLAKPFLSADLLDAVSRQVPAMLARH